MYNFFDDNGNTLPHVMIYDRDGFIKKEVQDELNSISVGSFPVRSDVVRCLYSIKVWNTYHVGSHQSVFSKI